MKKLENIFIGIGLFAAVAVIGTTIWRFGNGTGGHAETHEYPANKYGAFLAAQHAIYVNDFDSAAQFSAQLFDRDLPIVRNTEIMSEFLSGQMPKSANLLKDETGAAAELIYDAYLLQNSDWDAIYNRHKKDESALTAPLRIWSAVATGRVDSAISFVSKLGTNDSWKAFVRGQIYAETDKKEEAAKQFDHVSIDFMNINDYMYIMAFYIDNNMAGAADKLRLEFTSRPGGMYMLDVKLSPKWSEFSGLHNALAFSVVQNVSHTQVMMYSDLSLILLRFAQITGAKNADSDNTLNYYLGQYFFNNDGDASEYFTKIETSSPFYPFAMMKLAEETGKIKELVSAVDANPLFVPAVNKLVARHVQAGDKKQALRVIDRSLKNKNLTESGRAYFLKTRANINLTFGDLAAAQTDIRSAADVLPIDSGILATQSRIWSLEKRDLESAYEYAITLVKKNPTDIESWDVLGMAVWAREGADAALEVIEKVGQISNSCSVLFEHLGDLYTEIGNTKLARDAYLRAIDLSEDGMTVVPNLEKKIRNLK